VDRTAPQKEERLDLPRLQSHQAQQTQAETLCNDDPDITAGRAKLDRSSAVEPAVHQV